MALSRDVVIRLLGDADSAIKAQKAAADAAGVTAAQYRKAEREYDRSQRAMETASRKQRAAMEQVGRGSMIAGATVVTGLGLATKAAMDWESAWTGVLKTVNGSPAQLSQLETGLRGLARTLPATHAEIAGVAEAAGQLGVQTDSILEFTRVMVDLGETTNLSAEEAATSIAQMMNVMQTAPGDVDKLGSTLVALGNAGASTEKQIIEMAQRISGAAAVVGLSEDEVLALANAVASMGIEVESGGSSVSRVLTDMSKAAQTGGDELNVFAETAGMSAQEFSRAFTEDPAEAFASFIEGLAGVQEAGGNVFKILDDLGLSDVRVSQALLGMASSGDLLRESLKLGSRAWEENTALIDEAAKRYDTTAAKTEMARNALNDAAIEIGDVFLPVLASLAESVADVAAWFADLPAPVQSALSSLAGVTGVAMLAGGAFLLLFPRIMDAYKAFQTLNTAMPATASGLGKVGKAAGAAGALFATASAIDAVGKSLNEAAPSVEKTTKALLGLRESTEDFSALFSDIDGFSIGEQITDRFDAIGQSLASMVESGNGERAAEIFDVLAAEAERSGVSVEELKEMLPAYADALTGVENEHTEAAEAAREQAAQTALLRQDLDVAYGSLQGYAAALGLSEDATADLIQKSNELGESLGAFIDPLGTYTGLLEAKAQAEADAANKTAEKTGAQAKSWQDFVGSVHVSFDEYMAALLEQVAAQESWQTNMLLLAGRVSQGTLNELARMGPEGAPLVADLVSRSDAELDAFDDVTAKRSKEATDAWGAQLTMAAPVLAEIARKGGQGAADAAATALANGTSTLGKIASDWGVAIAGGVNPILGALGKPQVRFGGRGMPEFDSGGYTGSGGKHEPAGIVHAGEYVLTKEQTSRLGIDRIEDFANNGYAAGGFVSTSTVPRPPSTAPFRHPFSTTADAAMQKAYDGTVAWLAANLEPTGGSSAGLLPIMAAARQYVMDTYGVRNIGGFANRNIAGTNVKSDHAMGKAIDIMTTNLPLGWRIANDFAFGAARSRFNIENTIWQQSISSRGGRFTMMGDRGSPTQNHRDHIHADTYQSGTPYVPRDGFAYLHEGEAVVPSRINAASRAMPTMPVGSRGGSNAVASPPQVTLNARVFAQFGDETIEATATRVVVGALTGVVDRHTYNG